MASTPSPQANGNHHKGLFDTLGTLGRKKKIREGLFCSDFCFFYCKNHFFS